MPGVAVPAPGGADAGTRQPPELPPIHHRDRRRRARRRGARRNRPRRPAVPLRGGDHRRAAGGDGGRVAHLPPAHQRLPAAHPPDRPVRDPAQLGDRSQPRRARDRRRAGPGAPPRPRPRAAARHPDPGQGQLRHQGPDGDHRRVAGAAGVQGPEGRLRDPAAAPRGRGHPRQAEPVGVGQLPLAAVLQRLVGARRAVPEPLRAGPCGSSSGSGTAIAASLAAASLGTETDGSIVCPSSHNALVGIKPTLGLTSRSGVVPLAHSQDVTGPMARTVADAATVLGPMTGVDPRDPATADSRGHAFGDYRRFLDPDGLRGARIGVWREGVFGISPEADAIADAAIGELSRLGATVVDPADIPNVADVFGPELTVLLFEFKADIAAYLSELERTSMRTLADLIAFNDANAEQELRWFGQEIFLLAEETTGLDDPAYLEALRTSKRLAQEGIDGTLDRLDLDAIVSLTNSPPWTTDLVNGYHFLTASSTPAAAAGYPNITVPAGFSFGELPVGIYFIGRRWGEPTLIRLAHGFEQGTRVRHAPRFLPSWASGTSSPGTRAPERAAPARPRPPRAPRAPGPAPSPPGGSSPAGCSRRLVAGEDAATT